MTLEAEDLVRLVPDPAPNEGGRFVQIDAKLWPKLVRYAITEQINIETAVAQFVRDGLESA